MVVPPTPKPTRKAEALAKAPPTIASSCEENAALKKWHLPRLCEDGYLKKAGISKRQTKRNHAP
jgi:hypothetical protein